MKKILITTILLVISCDKNDDTCFITWNVTEYCTRPSGCSIVGCGESPVTQEKKFNCDEVRSVKNGDVVNYKNVECAKFYRKYNYMVK